MEQSLGAEGNVKDRIREGGQGEENPGGAPNVSLEKVSKTMTLKTWRFRIDIFK